MLRFVVSFIIICCIVLCFAGCQQADTYTVPSSSDIVSENSEQNAAINESNLSWYEKIDKNKFVRDVTSLVLETDDFIYYVSKQGVNKYSKHDYSDKLIVSDPDVDGLYLYEGKVYYHNFNKIQCIDSEDKVYDVWDWSKAPAEAQSEYLPEIDGFWFYKDYLYVMDSYISAIRIDVKTGKFEDFLMDFSRITFIGDYCYYIEHAGRTFSVYKMNINTKSVELFLGNGKYYKADPDPNKVFYDGVRSVGDELYYTTRTPEEATYLFNPNGNDIFLIPADDFNLEPFYTPDCFYYTVETDGRSELYEYSLKDRTNRLIATNNGMFEQLIITESFVLFRPHEDADMICLEY